MVAPRLRVKRTYTIPPSGVNALINAANKNDRFNLLEDDTVLPPDLINPVHPLFHQLQDHDHLQLALQLASHFLLHDRLLEFFVPLLYGREAFDVQSMDRYLCDPLVHASKARQGQLLSAVQRAFQCLAKHLVITFVDQESNQVYARTLAEDLQPPLTPSCCSAFQGTVAPKIELADKFLQFYTDPKGYAQASRCAQYRHDLLFATTLVHEVVHAVGVMRRGDTMEPYYRLGFPATEWGYAWENFMFGSILNPLEKEKPGTHLLMRRVWADAKVMDDNGGKEYCDVSMSWVGQWFRTETWNIVAERGPHAVAPPITHFKIQSNHKLGAWVVSSDSPDVRTDIAELKTLWRKSEKTPDKIQWIKRTTAELQQSNVPVPSRVREVPKPSLIKNLLLSSKPVPTVIKSTPKIHTLPPPITTPPVSAYRKSSPCRVQRKRRAEADSDDEYCPKVSKRIRT